MHDSILNRKTRAVKNFLYIEPFSNCNLACKMCYANVQPDIQLSPETILNFVERYAAWYREWFRIYWCGTGEVFLYQPFTSLVNQLTKKYGNSRIIHRIMTNGTIDRLDEISDKSNVELVVSIDGLKEQHDHNRGQGNYDKTTALCKKALTMGFKHVYARCLVTKRNVDSLLEIQSTLAEIGIPVDYNLPYTCKQARTIPKNGLLRDTFDDREMIDGLDLYEIVRERYADTVYLERHYTNINTYPALTNFGVFSCCEAVYKIGDINHSVPALVKNLKKATKQCSTCPLFHYC